MEETMRPQAKRELNSKPRTRIYLRILILGSREISRSIRMFEWGGLFGGEILSDMNF
jgi:hypothetical protein